jgi:hypothetical protein
MLYNTSNLQIEPTGGKESLNEISKNNGDGVLTSKHKATKVTNIFLVLKRHEEEA